MLRPIRLNGQISKENILNGNYATSTNASENTTNMQDTTNVTQEGNSTNESSGNSEQLETYTHTMKGDNGVIVTNQYLVREFREISDNFDQQIILELNTLFMALW